MCSYNKIQLSGQSEGIFSCDNPLSLQHLKQGMNFTGFVISDWYSYNHTKLQFLVPISFAPFPRIIKVVVLQRIDPLPIVGTPRRRRGHRCPH
eukprot:COSAG02_NODE_4861_length_4892_cov_3.521594_2_plen_93_part_00